MIALQSFGKLFIGVVAALLGSGKPMGFVAILGILALIGIVIRNSVILVTQIDQHEATQHHSRVETPPRGADAKVEPRIPAAVRRRPRQRDG